jgi:hypothetical protein
MRLILPNILFGVLANYPCIENLGFDTARNHVWSVVAKKLEPRQVVFWSALGSVSLCIARCP